MKRCPQCDFRFADFHHVCDFDGTDLVDDPERLAPEAPPTAAGSASLFLRMLKSPLFSIGLAVMALVASALLIGYYDSANQPNLIAQNPETPNSVATRVTPDQASAQTSTQVQPRAPSSTRSDITNSKAEQDFAARGERRVTASRSRSRLHSSASVRNKPSRSEIAQIGRAHV